MTPLSSCFEWADGREPAELWPRLAREQEREKLLRKLAAEMDAEFGLPVGRPCWYCEGDGCRVCGGTGCTVRMATYDGALSDAEAAA